MRRALCIGVLLGAAVCAQAQRPFAYGISQTEQATRGLVGYWSMRSSGTTVFDERGGNDGIATNSPTLSYASGVVGDGVGTSSGKYVYIPHDTNQWIGTSGSVSVWVQTASTKTQYVVDKFNNTVAGGDAGDYRGYIIWTSAGTARWTVGDAASDTVIGAAVNDSAWHHLCGTYDGATLRLYVDGGTPVTQACTRTPTPTIEPLAIGGSRPEMATVDFAGSIDEVRIYNVVLTADEIHQLYRMGATVYANR